MTNGKLKLTRTNTIIRKTEPKSDRKETKVDNSKLKSHASTSGTKVNESSRTSKTETFKSSTSNLKSKLSKQPSIVKESRTSDSDKNLANRSRKEYYRQSSLTDSPSQSSRQDDSKIHTSRTSKSISDKQKLTSRSKLELSKQSSVTSDLRSSRSSVSDNKASTSKTDLKSDNLKADINSTSSSNSKKVSLKSKTSRDNVSNRVTREQYFPGKYPFSSHLYEGDKKADKSKLVNGYLNESKSSEAKRSSKSDEVQKKSIEGHRSKKDEGTKGAKEKTQPKLTRERTKTKILTPDEVQVVRNIKKKKEETKLERPRTATIRKNQDPDDSSLSELTDSSLQHSKASTIRSKSRLNNPDSSSIDPENKDIKKNNNDVLPSTSKTEIQTNDDEYEYEDDFDSYESDFEEYESSNGTPTDISTDTSSTDSEENMEFARKHVTSTEVDEEKKLDSGTYDLHELKHKQVLDKIKEAIEKENTEISKKYMEPPSNLASLSDEGFDEKFSNGFINLTETKKMLQKPKAVSKRKKRGDDLMNMIRLDTVNYTLLNMKSISYDEFMQSYGQSGTVQVSSQTGDDDISEETQTESIDYTNRWTQFPVRVPNQIEPNASYNHLGVDKDPPETKSSLEPLFHNTKRLENFITNSSKLMLTLLESKNLNITEHIQKNQRDIPFSDGFVKLNIDSYPFLSERSVSHIAYSNSSVLLTVHKSKLEVYMNPDEQLLSRSIICIWNLFDLEKPQELLASSGEIIKACFDNKHNYLVFAGIIDG